MSRRPRVVSEAGRADPETRGFGDAGGFGARSLSAAASTKRRCFP